MFTRLAVPGADGTDTAAPAARGDLTAGKSAVQVEDMEVVLERFAAERLLTLDAGTVAVSHEVLLTAWPLLRDNWLADARADRVARTRLHATAAEWSRDSRDPSWLYRGTQLEAAAGTAARIAADPRQIPLSHTEKDFLHASRRASQRRARTRRQLVAVLLAMAAALTAVSIVAVRAEQRASAQRDINVSLLLSSQSETLGGTNATASRLDAIAAYSLDPSSQARYALLSAAASPQVAKFSAAPTGIVSVAFSAYGAILADCADDLVRQLDVASGQQIIIPIPADLALRGGRTGLGTDGAAPRAFSPDSKTVAIAGPDGIQLWNWVTGQPVSGLIAVGDGATAVAFSPDGKTVAVVSSDAAADLDGVQLWDWAAGKAVSRLIPVSDGATAVAFSPDGKTVAITGPDGVQLWDWATGQPVGWLADAGTSSVISVAFSPDGTTLATSGLDGTVRLWDVAAMRFSRRLGSPAANVMGVAFSPDGKALRPVRDFARKEWPCGQCG